MPPPLTPLQTPPLPYAVYDVDLHSMDSDGTIYHPHQLQKPSHQTCTPKVASEEGDLMLSTMAAQLEFQKNIYELLQQEALADSILNFEGAAEYHDEDNCHETEFRSKERERGLCKNQSLKLNGNNSIKNEGDENIKSDFFVYNIDSKTATLLSSTAAAVAAESEAADSSPLFTPPMSPFSSPVVVQFPELQLFPPPSANEDISSMISGSDNDLYLTRASSAPPIFSPTQPKQMTLVKPDACPSYQPQQTHDPLERELDLCLKERVLPIPCQSLLHESTTKTTAAISTKTRTLPKLEKTKQPKTESSLSVKRRKLNSKKSWSTSQAVSKQEQMSEPVESGLTTLVCLARAAPEGTVTATPVMNSAVLSISTIATTTTTTIAKTANTTATSTEAAATAYPSMFSLSSLSSTTVTPPVPVPVPAPVVPPRRYHCPTCHKSFLRDQDLSRHGATHMAMHERPYQCVNEGCGKRFGRRDAALRHARHFCSLKGDRVVDGGGIAGDGGSE